MGWCTRIRPALQILPTIIPALCQGSSPSCQPRSLCYLPHNQEQTNLYTNCPPASSTRVYGCQKTEGQVKGCDHHPLSQLALIHSYFGLTDKISWELRTSWKLPTGRKCPGSLVASIWKFSYQRALTESCFNAQTVRAGRPVTAQTQHDHSLQAEAASHNRFRANYRPRDTHWQSFMISSCDRTCTGANFSTFSL